MRRGAYTREELAAAVALAEAVLAQQRPDLPSYASGAVRLRAIRSRAPRGDFRYRTQSPPTADQLALVDQLRMGMLAKEHRRKKFLGPQGSYEPSGIKNKVGLLLGGLGFFTNQGGAPRDPVSGARDPVSAGVLKLSGKVIEPDLKRQLLDLTFIPSPPDRRIYAMVAALRG
jgi:hypothetical protein